MLITTANLIAVRIATKVLNEDVTYGEFQLLQYSNDVKVSLWHLHSLKYLQLCIDYDLRESYYVCKDSCANFEFICCKAYFKVRFLTSIQTKFTKISHF